VGVTSFWRWHCVLTGQRIVLAARSAYVWQFEDFYGNGEVTRYADPVICLLRQFQCKLPSVRGASASLVLLMMSFLWYDGKHGLTRRRILTNVRRPRGRLIATALALKSRNVKLKLFVICRRLFSFKSLDSNYIRMLSTLEHQWSHETLYSEEQSVLDLHAVIYCHWQAAVSNLESVLYSTTVLCCRTLLYNHFTRTQQKTKEACLLVRCLTLEILLLHACASRECVCRVVA
jgi:hypothetical protein